MSETRTFSADCSAYLRETGKASPRTCRVCGLGPCKFGPVKALPTPAQIVFRRAAEAYAARPGAHEYTQLAMAAMDWKREFERERAGKGAPAAEEHAARVGEPAEGRGGSTGFPGLTGKRKDYASHPPVGAKLAYGVPTDIEEPHQLTDKLPPIVFPSARLDDPTGTDPAPRINPEGAW